MPGALTADQLDQVVHNTVLVLGARPDLLDEWHANLERLLGETQAAALDDEAIFVAAVLTLLAFPGDTLPTGTPYDPAWHSIQRGLRTGVISAAPGPEGAKLEDLLRAVSEAAQAVLTAMPEERLAVAAEVQTIRTWAREAGADALAAWLDDVSALLAGAPPGTLRALHPEPYHMFWRALVDHLAAAPD